jgi:hypothetical protein
MVGRLKTIHQGDESQISVRVRDIECDWVVTRVCVLFDNNYFGSRLRFVILESLCSGNWAFLLNMRSHILGIWLTHQWLESRL